MVTMCRAGLRRPGPCAGALAGLWVSSESGSLLLYPLLCYPLRAWEVTGT